MQKALKFAAIAAMLGLAACSNDSSENEKTEDAKDGAPQTQDQKATDTMTEQAAFKAENLAYLEENKKKEGVQVTASGLQYRVVESGDGKSPSAEDFVTVHYAGRLIDGSEFDSSYKRGEPATFPAGRLIPGWTEALQMMQVGDKWELAIPAEIAYGPNGAGGVIPGDATLVFDVELLGVMSLEEAEAEARKQAETFKIQQLAFLEENAKQDGVTETESGLQYRVIEEGEGDSPTAEANVTVHYAGKLIDGTEFDSSYRRGTPTSFPLNGVIKGWTEGVQLMKPGAKYEFFIPYHLAYGERGSRSIPPYATLIFTVELVSVDS
ncbi:FKBP-type peptidyl-prolyl cis-trans isomerase [Kordiimonas sp.]|uniref:FKBP-type peptidyl-prolyl cis-trans isomerase n=1 Tax=Kordiimonas sp. TaxID=1970157 RepID=UPI003A942B0C